jgi:hypothetical protein
VKPSTMRLAAALLATLAWSAAAEAADPGLSTGQWSIVEMAGKRVRPPATRNCTRVRWLGLKTAGGPSWGWCAIAR